jgi:cell division septal protein FtsQ
MSPNISSAKFLNKLKFFLLFLILCSAFFLVVFFLYQFFLVRNIQLVSDKRFLLANNEDLINKNIFFSDTEEISKKIIRENYLIKTAKVEKIWPNSLKITVSFYENCVSLVVNNGFFNLSCDGRILQKTKDTPQFVPVINYYQKLNSNSFQTGDWVDYKDIKQALFLLAKIKEINLTALTIDIKGQDMLVFNLITGQQVVFSSSKDIDTQDYQLELIIKQFKIEGKEFKKIDLRFDKPIISF